MSFKIHGMYLFQFPLISGIGIKRAIKPRRRRPNWHRRITLEVTQSYLGIQKAKERKNVSEQGVAQAEENYRTMDGKYKQGLAANSELLDAEVALLQAKLNLTQSLVDYELAIAQLSRAIGE
jgi:outer membrane protein TolC